MQHLKIISAGAGSGKTYSLTKEMTRMLKPNANGVPEVRASGIIATTFTNKAAAELKERVRVELLESGLTKEADELGNAMIGTVHAIGVQLLKRFAFEAGVSPDVDIIADSDQQIFFNQSIATVLKVEMIKEMSELTELLGFEADPFNKRDWRRDLKNVTDIARANNFSVEILEASKAFSIQSYFELLPTVSEKSADYFDARLKELIESTIYALEEHEDATKAKETMLSKLKGFKIKMINQGQLTWRDWVAICKLKPSKKTTDTIFDLVEFAKTHVQHPNFHKNIKDYINNLFDAAIAAIIEYDNYKKSRGLIDYIDMEVLILQLLENESVLAVLDDEIDLLLVDEFQDTSPLQLKIFLKLTQIANQSVWVGDPKQSIYGFRGADPELMQAVMRSTDNIANLPDSWRSRETLVHLCNGLFVKALSNDMPVERIALNTAAPFVQSKESEKLTNAVHHWHFQFEKRQPANPWFDRCIARSVAELLEKGWMVRVKGSNAVRPLEAGDIAILCRSNFKCQSMAEALYDEGLKAAISRAGLVETAEAKLVLACMRYVFNSYDALAIAEILLLAQSFQIEAILESRLEYLNEEQEDAENSMAWAHDIPFVQLLASIANKSKELSSTELLNILMDKLDLRRIVSQWSNSAQRLDNLDALRKLSADYEDTCMRLNTAATSGGFLLWLDDLAQEGLDAQGRGVGKDAVNVLTYHKSKGLEWPLVICSSLENDLKDSIWGVRIVRTKDTIDINKPLADRLLCYWVNPYAKQVQGTQLMESVEAHPERSRSKKGALDEEIRLLYVGLTRARDYLVFPSVPKKNTKWLNRVFHDGDDKIPVLDTLKNELPWMWNDQQVFIQNHLFNYERNMSSTPIQEPSKVYFEPYKGVRTFEADETQLAAPLFPFLDFKIAQKIKLSSLTLNDASDDAQDEALKAIVKVFLLADNPSNTDNKKRLKMADNLIVDNALNALLDAADLLAYSDRFYQFLSDKWMAKKISKYQHFCYENKEQTKLNSSVDMWITNTENEQILIQFYTGNHSITNKNKSKFREIVSVLEAAQKSGISSLAAENYQFYLLAPLEGALYKLEVKRTAQQTTLFG